MPSLPCFERSGCAHIRLDSLPNMSASHSHWGDGISLRSVSSDFSITQHNFISLQEISQHSRHPIPAFDMVHICDFGRLATPSKSERSRAVGFLTGPHALLVEHIFCDFTSHVHTGRLSADQLRIARPFRFLAHSQNMTDIFNLLHIATNPYPNPKTVYPA